MSKADLQKLVEEGFRLDQEIKAAEKAVELKVERLEQIKTELKTAANGKPVDIVADGCKAEITFPPAPPRYLDAKVETKARKLAGTHFAKLFCLAPIKGFSDVARALLGDAAEKFLEAVCGDGSGRISFKRV